MISSTKNTSEGTCLSATSTRESNHGGNENNNLNIGSENATTHSGSFADIESKALLTHKFGDDVPKLWYFNARGRAELIRLLFAQANIFYEDKRFRSPPHAMEDFSEFKKRYKLPFGQVPLLFIDGLALAQSQAIVRYVSRKYGLMGKDETENALADMIHCGTEDLKGHFTRLIFRVGESPDRNSENGNVVQCFKEDTVSIWGTYFNRLLEENGGAWFVGSQLTYADFSVFDMMEVITKRIPDAFQNFPLLNNHYERVATLPNVKKYLSERSDTPI